MPRRAPSIHHAKRRAAARQRRSGRATSRIDDGWGRETIPCRAVQALLGTPRHATGDGSSRAAVGAVQRQGQPVLGAARSGRFGPRDAEQRQCSSAYSTRLFFSPAATPRHVLGHPASVRAPLGGMGYAPCMPRCLTGVSGRFISTRGVFVSPRAGDAGRRPAARRRAGTGVSLIQSGPL